MAAWTGLVPVVLVVVIVVSDFANVTGKFWYRASELSWCFSLEAS